MILQKDRGYRAVYDKQRKRFPVRVEAPEKVRKVSWPTLQGFRAKWQYGRLEMQVHAEVQLVCYAWASGYFYPSSGLSPTAPVYIVSSKKPCQLCHDFVSHFPYPFTIPDTHGNLYSRWRLPSPGACNGLSGTHPPLNRICSGICPCIDTYPEATTKHSSPSKSVSSHFTPQPNSLSSNSLISLPPTKTTSGRKQNRRSTRYGTSLSSKNIDPKCYDEDFPPLGAGEVEHRCTANNDASSNSLVPLLPPTKTALGADAPSNTSSVWPQSSSTPTVSLALSRASPIPSHPSSRDVVVRNMATPAETEIFTYDASSAEDFFMKYVAPRWHTSSNAHSGK